VAEAWDGAPRLLDASDLVGGMGGAAAKEGDQEVDVRSLQTYVLKLRNALATHAKSERTGAVARVSSAEAEGEALIRWAAQATATLTSLEAAAVEASAAATTAPARKANMEAAEAKHAAFERDCRGAEKSKQTADKAALAQAVAAVQTLLEAQERFDHGQPLNGEGGGEGGGKGEGEGGGEGVGSDGAALGQRLASVMARVDEAWGTMEGVEAKYEATLLTVLTHKQTDMMLAQAEMQMAAVAAWALEQTSLLSDANTEVTVDGRFESIEATRNGSEALACWLAGISSMAKQKEAVAATLVTVAARRVEEGREPIKADGEEACEASWAAMQTAAGALRRNVGAAAKWQSEQVKAVAARWAHMAGGLGAHLPPDGDLVGPELVGPPAPFALAVGHPDGAGAGAPSGAADDAGGCVLM